MLIDRYADDLVVWSPAKVNLHLEVLGKRPDGYHEIATLMVAVRLFDTLVIKEDASADLRLRCTDTKLSTEADNLVVRAAELLRSRSGCQRGASIRLVKRIPLAAGLAGGSSNAAATLAGLNTLWDLQLSNNELAELAAEIGSDIPFFLHSQAAWCTGRGEIVDPLTLNRPLWFVLACPTFGMNTADVYRNVSVPETPESGDAIRQAAVDGNIGDIGRHLHNRLQEAATRLQPALGTYLDRLAKKEVAGSLMSGSGSTLFALCRHRAEARRIARELRSDASANELRIFVVRSC